MSFVPVSTAVLNQWVRVLGALEKKVNRQAYETWLKPTRLSHVDGKIMYVRIPSTDFAHVGERYGDLIHEAIDQLGLGVEEVVFQAPVPDPAANRAVREDGGFAPQPSHSANAPRGGRQPLVPAGVGPEQSRFDWNTASQLNPRYHVRHVRHRQRQSVRARRGVGRRRAPVQGLQPAVCVRRRGARQDPPDAGHRPPGKAAPAACFDQLRFRARSLRTR